MEKTRLKAIAKACYPAYKGRKVRYSETREYTVTDYWSEGSRNYVVAYDLATGRVVEPSEMIHNPFNLHAHARVAIPAGVALVEHSIFCGHDAGITVIVARQPSLAAEAAANFLP